MTPRLAFAAAFALLAGCSPARVSPPAEHATGAAPVPTPRPSLATITRPACMPAYPGAFAECEFLGRWRGVEGMYLVVSKGDGRGRYRVEMQWDLDHHGVFAADAVSEPAAPGLVFTRSGKALTLRRSDGDATGLKHLAGKQDCLTVAPGEGWCRD